VRSMDKNRPRKRNRRSASLDTAEGRKFAADAGSWYVESCREKGQDVHKVVEPELGYSPTQNSWAETRVLPGYDEAIDSAKHALTTLIGRSRYVRDIYLPASGQVPWDAETLAIRDSLHHLFDLREHPTAYCRSLSSRLRNEKRRDKPHTVEIGKGRRATMPVPLIDLPVIDCNVVALWVRSGLWLCTDDVIAERLGSENHLEEFRGDKPVIVTSSNVGRVVSDLCLVRYKGKGRVVYENSALVMNDALAAEMRVALFEALGIEYEHAVKNFLDALEDG
jgi:hypothetical protein